MASVFDVAVYICEKMGTVTTMKLQKLCYYSQGWNLAWEDEPIFDEDFQAWANGPVCAELFEAHKGKFAISVSDFSYGSSDNLSETHKSNIDIVLRDYGEKPPHWLSELVQTETPWKDTRANNYCTPGSKCRAIIPKVEMQIYYAGLIDDEQKQES